MSWPTDGLPRYKAASIGPNVSVNGTLSWSKAYVYDRGICHRVVAVTRHKVRGTALRDAEASAAILNAGGELTPEQRGERPHGLYRYQAERCRCAICRAGNAADQRVRVARRRARA